MKFLSKPDQVALTHILKQTTLHHSVTVVTSLLVAHKLAALCFTPEGSEE